MNIQSISIAQQAYMNNRKYSNLPQGMVNVNSNNEPKPESEQANVNFKGLGDFVGKIFGKYYAVPMMEANWSRKVAEMLAGAKGSMTEHMATFGSAITSSVYMGRTLSNDELESDKKKTLAINQFLCFLIPTIAAYVVNSKLAGFNKRMEHRYAGLQKQKLALGEVTAEQAAKMKKLTSNRLKGFKTLASLGTFTLIYRYVTPVIITPIANAIGGYMNNKSKEKEAQKQQTQVAVA
jgi:hypothetical protein